MIGADQWLGRQIEQARVGAQVARDEDRRGEFIEVVLFERAHDRRIDMQLMGRGLDGELARLARRAQRRARPDLLFLCYVFDASSMTDSLIVFLPASLPSRVRAESPFAGARRIERRAPRRRARARPARPATGFAVTHSRRRNSAARRPARSNTRAGRI